MTTALTDFSGIITGCDVAAQASPDMTVAVTTGVVIADGVAGLVSAGNVTISAAHATQDRIDAVVADSTGALSAIAGDVNDGSNAQPPDTTGYALLKLVLVVNQASATYTGTITNDALVDSVFIDSGSIVEVVYLQLPSPADTLAWTFSSGALSNTDPGTGLFGFDSGTLSSITACYVNRLSASTGNSSKEWWQPSTSNLTTLPFLLKIWSRKQPENYMILFVTAMTMHGSPTTYIELTCTVAKATTALTTVQLSTDSLDCVFEFIGLVPLTAVTNGSAALGGDVTMTTANTFYDGPATGTLPAGTYIVFAQAVVVGGAGGINKITAKLWDGTTTYNEGELAATASAPASVVLFGIVTSSGSTSVKVSATSNQNNATMKRDAPDNSAGAHVATLIAWMRIA